MRRRQLLASLALTAAGAASTRISRGTPPAYRPESPDAGLDDILISRVRDAMLGLAPVPSAVSAGELRSGLASALADFHHCRYGRLADRLPRLISAGHLLAAENYAGDPGAAVTAAAQVPPMSLPTTERRARYWTDTARAYAQWGRREDSIQALLAAEHEAPHDVHARPAIRDLIRSQLITGRTSPELRGLAQRCGIT